MNTQHVPKTCEITKLNLTPYITLNLMNFKKVSIHNSVVKHTGSVSFLIVKVDIS